MMNEILDVIKRKELLNSQLLSMKGIKNAVQLQYPRVIE